MQSTMSQQQSTLFLCPVEGCDMRFKSTHGRTQHIFAKHPNFGINEPGHSGESSRSDNNLPVNGMNTRLGAHLSRSIDSSPSSHTSQFDQADEHMINDSDPPPVDFLQPPMTYNHFSSPPPFGELLPFPTSNLLPFTPMTEVQMQIILNRQSILSLRQLLFSSTIPPPIWQMSRLPALLLITTQFSMVNSIIQYWLHCAD